MSAVEARDGGWPLSRIDRIDSDECTVDGWLGDPFLDIEHGTSGLSVFDARHLADGPLWQSILPYPLPVGLHGTFVPA